MILEVHNKSGHWRAPKISVPTLTRVAPSAMAIAEGATLVRVGTDIFGARQ